MSWCCRIGLHNWHKAGFVSLVLPTQFEYCGRCMKGRIIDFTATWHYTPEQTKEFLLNDMREHGAEIVPAIAARAEAGGES